MIVPGVGGIVLCGGNSTRMGRPKLSLPFGPEVMLQRVVRIVSSVVSPVVVVAAVGQELPPLPSDVLIGRDEDESLGPLAGLAVGLKLLRPLVPAAFVSAVDAPLLEPAFIRAMIDRLGSCELAVPREEAFHHPLAAVYRTELDERVRKLIDARRLRPLFLIQESKSCEVPTDELLSVDPGLRSLRNTNTPDTYEAALREAGLLPAAAAAVSSRVGDCRQPPAPSATAMSLPAVRPTDVRMRGFAARARVEDAIAWIDSQTAPLESEAVPLDNLCSRVLAVPVVAACDVPSFDRAAMDGYAVVADETEGAGDYNPLAFQVVGEAMPGRPFVCVPAAAGVARRTAVRIMTGAPLPPGYNSVVPAEFAAVSGGRVEITAVVTPGKHVGQCGEDVRSGATLLVSGRRLRPQDVALVASVGCAAADVIRQPRVRILVTGNELATPGEPRGEHQIYEANSAMLRGLVLRDGGVLESVRRLRDDRDAIRAALTEPGADVLLISGGSSVGAEDHAPSLLASEGELAIHGIAMRPSSPAGMGRIGNTIVFLLPGNPVSCLCAYDFFAGRAIRRLGGLPGEWPYRPVQATVERKIVSAIGRVDYCRVRLLGGHDTDRRIEPLAISGASILSSTTRADGFVVVPAESEGLAPGSQATVWLYQ